jgi:uncharacterized protein
MTGLKKEFGYRGDMIQRVNTSVNTADKQLLSKYENLKEILAGSNKAAIAFSGGVDSTFLLKVCVDLFKDKVLALTANSELIPKREIKEASFLAEQIGVVHIIVDLEALQTPGFSDNPLDRCFLCKTAIFSQLKSIASTHGFNTMFDGSNADDINDYRPGRAAAKKLGVQSPLEEAKLTKNDIRAFSKLIDLSTWDKPSYACLASRFPYHTRITKADLARVENAETYLLEQGMRVFRVRHHDTVARIELGDKETRMIWEPDLKERIICYFKTIGYKHISLDLEGYRSGSMN